MAFFSRNPIFYTLALLLVGACLYGAFYLVRLGKELSVLENSYETKASQYDRYLDNSPSPTRSNLEAIEENYRELYSIFEETMRILKLNTFNTEELYGRTPESRADWSFALHKYKENARYAALSNSIELAANADFGFERYAKATPPAEEMESVHQQIVVSSILLDTLFDSGIRSFTKLQRGVFPERGRPTGINRRADDKLFNEGDRFTVLPGQSLRESGTIDSYVFRVVFSGQSIALRRFLNHLGDSNLPFVVRGIEADLSSEGGEKRGLESFASRPFSGSQNEIDLDRKSVPIISDNTSLFVVTIEFLRLAVEVEMPLSKGGEESA